MSVFSRQCGYEQALDLREMVRVKKQYRDGLAIPENLYIELLETRVNEVLAQKTSQAFLEFTMLLDPALPSLVKDCHVPAQP